MMNRAAYASPPFVPSQYPDPPPAAGLGIHYDGYDTYPSGYHSGGSLHSHTGSPYLASSPASPPRDVGIRTRSGRNLGRKDSPQSTTPKSASPSIKKNGEKKTKTPKITAPLSELTKHLTDIPVRDMQAWVNRPIEERLEEAKKRKGYITRPMNSFMLYRSAYAERTKAWCAENNHQVVSSVSGESWPMEPVVVREFYNDLAKIERVNHQSAHPHYKFSPAKPGLAGRKRKGTGDSGDDSGASDDDPDADWGASHKRTRVKRPDRNAGYPTRNTAPTGGVDFEESYANPAWEANGLGRPLPQAIGHYGPYGNQYYQAQVQSHPYVVAGVENGGFSALDMPGSYGGSTQSLIGLPGQSHYELQTLHSQSPTPINVGQESQVDPMLLGSYDPNQPGLPLDDGLALAHSLHYDAPYPACDYVGSYRTQEYPANSEWHSEHAGPAFEQPSEFEKYWDEARYGGPVEQIAIVQHESRKTSAENKAAALATAAAEKAMAKALTAALLSPNANG